METLLPDWVVVGESVLVRPYSYSGVIAYVGSTEFASGTWIGVELDAPTGANTKYYFLIVIFYYFLTIDRISYVSYNVPGKNDGAVNGHKYFTCRPKCGIFVKVDKLIQDRRGRALRSYSKQESAPAPSALMRRSVSKGNFALIILSH